MTTLLPGGPAIDTLYAAMQVLSVGSARTLGVTMLFTAFTWGQIGSGVLRGVFALCLALPVVAPLWSAPLTAIHEFDAPFVIVLLKELAIGATIGFVGALPLEAFGAAGGAVDSYVGASSVHSPTGETTPLGQMFTIIGLWLFASLGGFWRISDAIYASYAVWPLDSVAPMLNGGAPAMMLELVTRMVVLAATLAGPLLLLLLLVDLSVLISAKLGKRINVVFLAPALKALALILTLPLFGYVFVRVATGELARVLDPRLVVQLLSQ